jgi:hypothetical protein
MTAEQAASGPDTGPYEVIHLGGQAAVVVPVADFLRLRALERGASPQELEDAEDTAAMLQWKVRDAAGQTTFVPADKARRRLGLPGEPADRIGPRGTLERIVTPEATIVPGASRGLIRRFRPPGACLPKRPRRAEADRSGWGRGLVLAPRSGRLRGPAGTEQGEHAADELSGRVSGHERVLFVAGACRARRAARLSASVSAWRCRSLMWALARSCRMVEYMAVSSKVVRTGSPGASERDRTGQAGKLPAAGIC